MLALEETGILVVWSYTLTNGSCIKIGAQPSIWYVPLAAQPQDLRTSLASEFSRHWCGWFEISCLEVINIRCKNSMLPLRSREW